MNAQTANVRLGYNTNGFAFHQLDDAIEILAALGYRGIALTPDVHHLNPYRSTAADVASVRRLLERLGLTCVIETGARFLLDPRRKHSPTLVSRERSEIRVDFLRRCLHVAANLGAPVVSFWSGACDASGSSMVEEFATLRDRCRPLLDEAERLGVTLALEPEPGMLIDGLDAFRRFDSTLSDPRLALTLDVGHLHLTESEPPEDCLRAWAARLRNVHLDDMRRPLHEHLAFGDGEIAFRPVLKTLRDIGFTGLASVELSRHGHVAVECATRAIQFLGPLATAP
ncbi:MAG: sugar phosphate isomerase/epimerase [Planctomycetes bacterium]|nr:sugar phosphate isomerase/epimerase [Planctomycetota bacterium]